ncbi:MAG TPA: exosome complex protein Rrp42 [Candidatus Nanoarchaeia archaeon]|nr:exosome complex protein Rrp42 [Candidatus Nanoarchaeia archaeon]
MHNELKSQVLKLLASGLRLDGRKATEYRKPIKVEYGFTKTAEGSAKVTIGDTEVIAGVKLEIMTPYPDTPDQGSIMVGAELLPLSSPEFELGPPGNQAIELARVVDRGIRESKAIDFKALCIEPGVKAWMVVIDLCTINDAGNLFDVCALAALAALKNAKFPKYEDGKIDYRTKTSEELPLQEEPISVTVLKIGNHFIVDPDNEEELVAEARLTVAIMSDGSLCALQKGGEFAIKLEDVNQMIGIASDGSKALREAL